MTLTLQEPGAAAKPDGPDPLALLDGVPLTEDEAGYVQAARSATLCGAIARIGTNSPSGPPNAALRCYRPIRPLSLATCPTSHGTAPRSAQ